MEVSKNFFKNIALLLGVGIVPSLCWAAGFFPPFSWPSFFLFSSAFFCFLWLISRRSAHILKKLLLVEGEEWALYEGETVIDRSLYFPGDSLESFKDFLHPDSLEKVSLLLRGLVHEKASFQLRVRTRGSQAIYRVRGVPFGERFVLLLNNITDSEHQEQSHLEKLHKNEKLLTHLHATLDLMPVLVWHRDSQQKIIYCNHAYAEAVQASSEKIYQDGIELISFRVARTLARKAFNAKEPQVLSSHAIADGERKYFRIHEMPNPLGEGTIGIAYDITEVFTIKAETKRLEEAHRTVLEHLSTAVAVYDQDSVLQYYNKAYVSLYHFDEKFLQEKPRLEEVLEDLRERRKIPEYSDFPAYKKQHLLQLKEQVSPKEDMVHLPDERTLRIFSSPHPLGGLLFMFEDVTNYLALESSKKALFDAYQTTIDNLFEGVVVIGSDSRLKIFNQSFAHLWGLQGKDIQHGQHMTVILDKTKDLFDYSEGNWDSFKEKVLKNLTDRVPNTGQLLRKDGTVINFGYVPLPNGDHLFSYTDATNTSLVQQALQEKNDALQTADRLKSEFMANVSYELRSPLTTIVGFTEILSRQYFGTLNERQLDYVNGVWESSQKLLHLVNDLLDLASLEAGYLTLELSSVPIPALIKEVIDLTAKRADDNQQYITSHVDQSVESWVLDERRVKQALFNLLSNAMKFSASGATISIRAMVGEEALEISVADTGVGISAADQSQIFDKDKRSSGVAGLELALVKNIIELHGGHVRLTSEVHKGTCVTCVFPRSMQDAPFSDRDSLQKVQGQRA